MKTSGSMLGNGVLNYALGNIDYLIVGRRFGATQLGYYQAAFSLAAELRNRLSGPLQKILFPAYSLVRGEPERFRRGVTTSLLLLAAVVAPLGFGLSATAEEVVTLLYGPKWLAAIPLLQALGIAGAMRAIFSLCASMFYAINRADALFKLTLLGAPVRFGLVIAGSYWGPFGIACGMTIAQVMGFVTGVVAFRLCGIPVRQFFNSLWPVFVAAIVMVLAVTLTRPHLAEMALVERFAALVSIGAICYALLLAVLAPKVIAQALSIAGSLKSMAKRAP